MARRSAFITLPQQGHYESFLNHPTALLCPTARTLKVLPPHTNHGATWHDCASSKPRSVKAGGREPSACGAPLLDVNLRLLLHTAAAVIAGRRTIGQRRHVQRNRRARPGGRQARQR